MPADRDAFSRFDERLQPTPYFRSTVITGFTSSRPSLLSSKPMPMASQVGSDAYVESTLIRDTIARPDGDLGVGVSAELRPETGRRSSATIVDSIIAGNRVLGIGAVTSDVSVMHTMIGDTVAYDDNFGDGVVGLHYYAEPAVLVISESLVTQSARAGVAAFGSDVTLSSTRFDCNAIHLDSEPHAGRSSSFSDDGANVCGCGVDAVTCKALSSSIEPPDPPQL
jgi:hypothetical protein